MEPNTYKPPAATVEPVRPTAAAKKLRKLLLAVLVVCAVLIALVYFLSGKQMTVVSHLCFLSNAAVEYDWHGHPFYAYTICYDFESGTSLRQTPEKNELPTQDER